MLAARVLRPLLLLHAKKKSLKHRFSSSNKIKLFKSKSRWQQKIEYDFSTNPLRSCQPPTQNRSTTTLILAVLHNTQPHSSQKESFNMQSSILHPWHIKCDVLSSLLYRLNNQQNWLCLLVPNCENYMLSSKESLM